MGHIPSRNYKHTIRIFDTHYVDPSLWQLPPSYVHPNLTLASVASPTSLVAFLLGTAMYLFIYARTPHAPLRIHLGLLLYTARKNHVC